MFARIRQTFAFEWVHVGLYISLTHCFSLISDNHNHHIIQGRFFGLYFLSQKTIKDDRTSQNGRNES